MTIIAPSMLASDWGVISEEAKAITAAGADWLHLDVMDGSFVPPISFGADFVKAVKRSCALPLDVHLMIENPDRHLEAFVQAGATSITVHFETCPHLHRTIQRIHELGAKAGVALNPATPVTLTKDILPHIELLLIMSVNPGWGGQKFIAGSVKKITEAAALIKAGGNHVLIQVDGGINEATAKLCSSAGAEVFVSGSYIFQKKGSYAQAIQSLRC